MDHALVVYESMFGNTQTIANAVADGLSLHMTVDIAEVGTAPVVIGDIDLLVVGGPTHAFGMSRKGTREGAAKETREKLVSDGIGLREWLETVHKGPAAVAAAAFDTRFSKPHWLVGSAARAAQKRLERLGFRVVAPAQSFYVGGTTEPLLDGERERARSWGERLGFESTVPEHDRRVS